MEAMRVNGMSALSRAIGLVISIAALGGCTSEVSGEDEPIEQTADALTATSSTYTYWDPVSSKSRTVGYRFSRDGGYAKSTRTSGYYGYMYVSIRCQRPNGYRYTKSSSATQNTVSFVDASCASVEDTSLGSVHRIGATSGSTLTWTTGCYSLASGVYC